MKAVNQNGAEKKEVSPVKLWYQRSWEVLNTIIIIFGALVPILFGVVILLLILKENELLEITGTVLLVTAGVFVLLWVIAFIAEIIEL